MRRHLHVECKFYIHINMLLLQESVRIFQSMVGQEDNEEERRTNLHQRWIIPGPARTLKTTEQHL